MGHRAAPCLRSPRPPPPRDRPSSCTAPSPTRCPAVTPRRSSTRASPPARSNKCTPIWRRSTRTSRRTPALRASWPTRPSSRKRRRILAKLGKEAGFHAFTGNFLNLLVDKRRENQIEAIIAEFETLFCEATDTQVATVTSAVKLENEQQFMIAKKLQGMTGAKNIKLKPEVDESLLGGFVVQYGKDGSGFIDMSVRGQVDKLASVFVN